MQVGVQHHRENLKKKTSPKQPKKRKNTTTICKRCVCVEIFFIVHYKTCFKSQVVKSWGALMLTSIGQRQKRPRWLLLPSHQSGKVSIVNTVTRSRSRSQEERSPSVCWIVWILQRFLTIRENSRDQSDIFNKTGCFVWTTTRNVLLSKCSPFRSRRKQMFQYRCLIIGSVFVSLNLVKMETGLSWIFPFHDY